MRNRSSKESDPESQRLLSHSDSEEKKKLSSQQKRKSRIEPFKCSPNLSLWDFLNPIKAFLMALDIFLILVTFKWLSVFSRRSPKVVLKKDAMSNRTNRRHYKSSSELVSKCFGCSTAYEVAARAFNVYSLKQCMGTRKFLGMKQWKSERFPRKLFGETRWMNFKDVGSRAHAFGAGLIKIGLVSLPKTEGQEDHFVQLSQNKIAPSLKTEKNAFEKSNKSHTLLIYEETCADWMTALIGAMSQSLVCATSYATLGPDSVADAVNECKCKAILCNMKDVEKIDNMASRMPTLTHIVYTKNYVTEEQVKKFSFKSKNGLTIMSMDQVVELGIKNSIPPNPPTPENMAVVMYTSGSTGKPKGVMIRQKNLVASGGMFLRYVRDTKFLREGEETYIAYLPAAHIMELCVEFAMLGYGGRIGYSDVRSFSSAGALRVDESTGEIHADAKMSYPADERLNFAPGGLQAFRPTFVIAVPKIWDILKKGVEEKVTTKPALVKSLIQLGFAWRHNLLQNGLDSVLFTKLFQKVFTPILGGQQKLFATGGGPISSEVQSFVRTIFCCPLVQGYALTESCCAGTIQFQNDPRDGVVGPPAASVEICLASCTEVCDRDGKPYLETDTSHYGLPCRGRGEVLIRGHSVSSGYLKKIEKTQKEFDKYGYFHTGDIAIFTTDGCIKIVDRLKNLVKLKGGEYIALESMEKEYAKSIFVDGKNGGVMCYGDGDMDRPVAFVQANVKEIQRWAREQSDVDDKNVEAMLKHPKVLKLVLNDLLNEGKKGGVGRNERLCAIHLISGQGSPDRPEVNSPFTPENGYLTASNKLQRKGVIKGMSSVMDSLKRKGIR